jgi:hypothetical protein
VYEETSHDYLQVSLPASHSHVFFTTFGLDSIQAWIAASESVASESVVGIVIEGVFVAMLIQRFFGR